MVVAPRWPRGPVVTIIGTGLAVVLAALAAQTVLVWVALAGLIVFISSRGRLAWWPAATAVVLAAVLNSLKWPDSDLAEYYAYLDYARAYGLYALLTDENLFVSIKPTEPVFRAFAWLAAHMTPAPKIAFALLSGLITYGAALQMCRMVTARPHARERGSATPAAAACAVALLVGITFSLVGHLVRQYLAGAIFFLGFFGHLTTERRRWLLLPLLACAIHNATLLLAGPLLLSMGLYARPRLFAAVLVAVLAAAELQHIPLLSDLMADLSFLKQDGEIGYALPLLDATILLLAWRVWQRTPPSERPFDRAALARVACFALALGVLLFAIREVSLLFFRSYFFIEFLRVPALAFVLCAWLRRAGDARRWLMPLVLIVAVSVCWQRARTSDWSYSSASGAGWPDWADIHRTMVRWQAIEGARL
jgi:EpsG family